jgi:hypothetical protein
VAKIVIPKNIDNFIKNVINSFNIAIQGKTYSYLEYLSLPPNIRGNDEADVVDMHFTESALEWLGFHKTEAQYKYNTTTTKPKTESQRPDFVALSTIGTADNPLLFDNSLWRFRANPNTTLNQLRAFLGLICSRPIAYLINLFSTNNNVALDDIKAVPMPDTKTLPQEQLNISVQKCLEIRNKIQSEFLDKYEIESLELKQELSLPIDRVFAKCPFPKITFKNAELIGLVKVQGQGKIGTLLKNNKITLNGSGEFNDAVMDLLHAIEEDSLSDVLQIHLPDPSTVSQWFNYLDMQRKSLKEMWENFSILQHEIDNIIFNWYGLDNISRDAIIEGLPWAKQN